MVYYLFIQYLMAKSKELKNKNKQVDDNAKTQRESLKEKNKEKAKQHKTIDDQHDKHKKSVDSKSESDNEHESFHEETEESIKDKFDIQLKTVNEKLKLDNSLLLKAIHCLKGILNEKSKNENNILFRKDEEAVHINFTFGNIPEQYSLRPVLLPVKINSNARRRVCLIIRDPVEEWNELNISFDDVKDLDVNIITYSSLKQEYFQYESKRNLLKQFDVFLCDSHLYMMLKKILGKCFYSAKKYPLAVKIDKKKEMSNETKQSIINAAQNQIFYMSNGPNYSVKAGFVEEDDKILLDKTITATKFTLAHILKWGVDFEHLKTISVKITNSIELPVFNQLTKEEILTGKDLIAEEKKSKVVQTAQTSKDTKEIKDSKEKSKGKNKSK